MVDGVPEDRPKTVFWQRLLVSPPSVLFLPLSVLFGNVVDATDTARERQLPLPPKVGEARPSEPRMRRGLWEAESCRRGPSRFRRAPSAAKHQLGRTSHFVGETKTPPVAADRPWIQTSWERQRRGRVCRELLLLTVGVGEAAGLSERSELL